MSFPPPSAPPFSGVQAPQQTYPTPTYTHPPPPGSHEPPPPYDPNPPHQAAPLPSKHSYSTQPPYQQPPQPGGHLPYQAYTPQAGHQPYSTPPGPGYQTTPPFQPGYQTAPPSSGYQTTPPFQPGYQTAPPSSGYQTTPPFQPGYQTAPPSSGYPTVPPFQPGYQTTVPSSTYQTTPPQPGYPGYQPPSSQPSYSTQPQAYETQQLTNQMAGMNLQQRPTKAGDSPLLASFTQGNVVILTSFASGSTLRINNDSIVEGRGGHGELAQFRVHVRRPGVVALQNVHNPDNWLAIYQGRTIGTGTGDPYCDFLINEIEGRYVCLESVMAPGQYVGILPDGSVKPAGSTRTGPHGRFTVIVHHQVPTTSESQSVFSQGNIIILRSRTSGKSLRIAAGGNVQGTGGRGQFAQFRVHVRRPGVVALQNVHNPENWLAIKEGRTLGTGRGGLYCDFEVKEIGGQYVCLESVMYPSQHVGVLPDGRVKPPTKTRKGHHGQFTASVYSSAPTTTSQQPPAFAAQPTPHFAGASIQSMFSQGNVVILQSNASGKSLRINESGDVQGTGGRGQFAQFRVHVRRPGVVALQNIQNPDNWLAIFQGQTIGTGKGGEFSEFKFVVLEGRYVCLESVKHPGQYVGILPGGSVKPPGSTKTGPHGRFIPSLHI